MAEDMTGGDQGGQPPPPDNSAVSPPPSPQGGGGTLPPQGAPASQAVPALGQQAMARAKLKLIVHTLHREIFPAFELNSDEGKAVQKALNALATFGGGGKEDGDKNSAMSALMQRAMQARAGGPGGGQPGMPQPNRGPIPTMAGTQ
jgi:hypothetical protein